MRLPRERQILTSSLLFVSLLFISNVAAQGLPKLPGTNTAAAATSGAAATSAAAKGSTDSANPSATTTGSASGSSSGSKLPAISTDAGALTGLPKLAGQNYPAPTVPPTANAPFMQKSALPEGTVFICVGAALGFIGFLVLAWRGLVAWSLSRSVKKAAIAQSTKYSHGQDPRATLGKTKGPYFSPGPGSTLSLDQLGASGKHVGGNSAHNSLFFSPTAGAGMNTPSNRGSGYLPAGYYAAGNSAPGGGSGMTHIGGGAMPLSNLSKEKRYSRAPSPPGSIPPSRGLESGYGRLSTQGLTSNASNSSLNLSAPPQGRAPSAYLEDLFENHPPGQMPPEVEGRRF